MCVAQYMDTHRSQPPMSMAAAFGHPAMAQFQNRTMTAAGLVTSSIVETRDLSGGGKGEVACDVQKCIK
jgi:hypothetical protein